MILLAKNVDGVYSADPVKDPTAVKYDTTPSVIRKDHIAELQSVLEDDDCMLPYRWRKPSELTISAKIAADTLEVLRNGVDRKWDDADNGVWVAPDENLIEYQWKKPVTLSGVRIIFDSDLKYRGKRIP